MRLSVGRLALLLLFLLPGGAIAQAQPTPAFKAGFAERDITPEIGMEAPGGYGKAYHRTLHDACKVRASVFDDGHNRVALVGIDALGIRRDTVQKVRAAVEARTGIPAQSILIGASHSHSSGPIVWIMPGEFDDCSRPRPAPGVQGIDLRGPEVPGPGRTGPDRCDLRGE